MMHQHNFAPAARGFNALYRANEVNHCPGCGRSHWIVGRLTAECAFCATALPIAGDISRGPAATVFQNRHIAPAARGRFTINGKAA